MLPLPGPGRCHACIVPGHRCHLPLLARQPSPRCRPIAPGQRSEDRADRAGNLEPRPEWLRRKVRRCDMDALQILILVVTPSLVVFSVWTLLSVRELWPRAGRPPIPTTPAPRDIFTSGDLAPVIGTPEAPGPPATVTAPAPFEFEISCVGAACQGSRSCQLVWRCLGAPERSDYRPVGTHLAEAVDQSSVWACSCGLAPELIPTECRAIIQTHYNPEAPGGLPAG